MYFNISGFGYKTYTCQEAQFVVFLVFLWDLLTITKIYNIITLP